MNVFHIYIDYIIL